MTRFNMKALAASLVLLSACWATSNANAAVVNLVDGNTTVTLDTESQAGIYNFSVDGVDHLSQEWFWFRVGDQEFSLDTLGAPTINTQTSSILDATYTGSGFNIRLILSVLGGTNGSGTGDLSEDIRITNTGTSPLNISFFQYADFDIGGSFSDDFGWFDANDSVNVADGSAAVSETDVSPLPTHREISTFSTLRDSLNDGAATTLSDLPPIFPGGFIGPADVVWGFQWDRILAAGGSLVISKDKLITPGPPDNGPLVPEPASLAIWGGLSVLGLVFGGRLRRKAA